MACRQYALTASEASLTSYLDRRMSMPGVVLAFVHGARYGLCSPQLRAEIPFRIEFECGAAERLGGRSRLAREEFAAARLGAQLVVLDEHFAAQQHGRGPA